MVDLTTFLLVLSCAISLIAIIMSEKALNASRKLPEVPAKAFNEIARLRADLESVDQRLVGHCKREASAAGMEAKKAKASGGNGGMRVGDYAALDSAVFQAMTAERSK